MGALSVSDKYGEAAIAVLGEVGVPRNGLDRREASPIRLRNGLWRAKIPLVRVDREIEGDGGVRLPGQSLQGVLVDHVGRWAPSVNPRGPAALFDS
jgi:hypothetical protein